MGNKSFINAMIGKDENGETLYAYACQACGAVYWDTEEATMNIRLCGKCRERNNSRFINGEQHYG